MTMIIPKAICWQSSKNHLRTKTTVSRFLYERSFIYFHAKSSDTLILAVPGRVEVEGLLSDVVEGRFSPESKMFQEDLKNGTTCSHSILSVLIVLQF